MPDLSAPRILIVEDEPDIARSLGRILSRNLAATTTWVASLGEARATLGSNGFDLVTLDYALPDGDGLTLLEEIKAARDAPPVVMVTGQGCEEVAARAFRLGVNDYVQKTPSLKESLLSAVEGALTAARLKKAAEIEHLYRDLFQSLRAGFVRTDTEGNILEANPAYVRMHGYEEGELRGMKLSDLAAPGSLWIEEAACSRELAHRGYTDIHELNHVRKDGTEFPADVQIWAVNDEEGKPVGRWALVRDITSRWRARTRIAHQESILESVNEAVIACDAGMRITSWNKGAERMFGYTREEVIGRRQHEVLNQGRPGGNSECDELFRTLRESGKLRCETVQYAKDGTPLLVEITSWCLTGPGGDVTGYLGINRDVTGSREAERLLGQVLDNLPFPVFLLDAQGRTVYVNEVTRDLFGGKVPDGTALLRMSTTCRSHPGGMVPPPGERAPVERALPGESSGAAGMEMDVNGARARLEVFAAPIPGPDGDVEYTVVVLREIHT